MRYMGDSLGISDLHIFPEGFGKAGNTRKLPQTDCLICVSVSDVVHFPESKNEGNQIIR
jgi:hypothetical protein